jgi:hypothetical protein
MQDHAVDVLEDVEYDAFAASLRGRFALATRQGAPLFRSQVSGRTLWDLYLNHLRGDIRQVHNCETCRAFISRYGALVTIDQNGDLHSVMWQDDVPEPYARSARALREAVEREGVAGAFYSSNTSWGTATTGDWHHLHVIPPASLVHTRPDLTAGQLMAEKAEDRRMLMSALHDYTEQHLEAAVNLLNSEALYRSEKVLGRAQYLLALKKAIAGAADSRRRHAGIWLSAVTAPAGFCHVKSSMIGSLLDDIAAGMPIAGIKARFAEKMKAENYQRPKAAPTAGNIKQAEKLVDKLGIAASLKRRMARLSDLTLEWAPPVEKAQTGGGVFGHLAAKKQPQVALHGVTTGNMTWSKFARTLLPGATRIEVLAPARGNYNGLLTAADPDAPPILQWDLEGQRNPVSGYQYINHSSPSNWGISSGWNDAIGICLQPHMHSRVQGNRPPGAIVLLKGARDLNLQGSCLFPENLKSELHAVRATIEAYSNTTPVPTDPEGVAGLPVVGTTFRVHSAGGSTTVTVDRWD